MRQIFKNRAGFSLVEIMIAVGLLGVILVFGGASLLEFKKSEKDIVSKSEAEAFRNLMLSITTNEYACQAAFERTPFGGGATIIHSEHGINNFFKNRELLNSPASPYRYVAGNPATDRHYTEELKVHEINTGAMSIVDGKQFPNNDYYIKGMEPSGAGTTEKTHTVYKIGANTVVFSMSLGGTGSAKISPNLKSATPKYYAFSPARVSWEIGMIRADGKIIKPPGFWHVDFTLKLAVASIATNIDRLEDEATSSNIDAILAERADTGKVSGEIISCRSGSDGWDLTEFQRVSQTGTGGASGGENKRCPEGSRLVNRAGNFVCEQMGIQYEDCKSELGGILVRIGDSKSQDKYQCRYMYCPAGTVPYGFLPAQADEYTGREDLAHAFNFTVSRYVLEGDQAVQRDFPPKGPGDVACCAPTDCTANAASLCTHHIVFSQKCRTLCTDPGTGQPMTGLKDSGRVPATVGGAALFAPGVMRDESQRDKDNSYCSADYAGRCKFLRETPSWSDAVPPLNAAQCDYARRKGLDMGFCNGSTAGIAEYTNVIFGPDGTACTLP